MPAATGTLTPTDVRRLRARLAAERRHLVADYDKDVERERAIDAAEVGDPVERAEAARERQELRAAAADEHDRLGLVDDALERIAAGTYGRCLADGEPIPLRRLEAVPWTRYCILHQELWETGEAEPPLGLDTAG